MKKFLVLAFVFGCSVAFAGSGSGIIPFWKKFRSSTDMSCYVMVSNITDATVTVKIKLLDSSGTEYTESTETSYTNLTVHGDFTGDPLSGSGATLGANGTGYLRIYLGDSYYGYGQISWETSGDESVALIAHTKIVHSNLSGEGKLDKMIFPVNDFAPF